MPNNGSYSKADIAKKLSGAIGRLHKHHLQNAVSLLFDALGLIEKQSPEQLIGLVPWDWSPGWHVREWGGTTTGAAEGEHGRGFSRASVAEHITLALLAMGGNNWGVAASEIYTTLAGMYVLAEQGGKPMQLVGTGGMQHHRE